MTEVRRSGVNRMKQILEVIEALDEGREDIEEIEGEVDRLIAKGDRLRITASRIAEEIDIDATRTARLLLHYQRTGVVSRTSFVNNGTEKFDYTLTKSGQQRLDYFRGDRGD